MFAKVGRTTRAAAMVLFAALAMAAPAALGAAQGQRAGVLTLDPAHTTIEFRLTGDLHTTHGSFWLRSGTIRVDPATGKAGGEVIVDADTGQTGISMRDSTMKDSVLEVNRFPEITFTPQSVTGQRMPDGSFRAELLGVLQVHGADHPITIDTQGRLSGDEVTATGNFTVPYVKWGMKNPSFLFLTVADTVAIDVSVEGHVTWIGAAPSAASSSNGSEGSSARKPAR
jgi:polyisoprenoid-binding protein YceI